jgi:hypothetical protein
MWSYFFHKRSSGFDTAIIVHHRFSVLLAVSKPQQLTRGGVWEVTTKNVGLFFVIGFLFAYTFSYWLFDFERTNSIVYYPWKARIYFPLFRFNIVFTLLWIRTGLLLRTNNNWIPKRTILHRFSQAQFWSEKSDFTVKEDLLIPHFYGVGCMKSVSQIRTLFSPWIFYYRARHTIYSGSITDIKHLLSGFLTSV